MKTYGSFFKLPLENIFSIVSKIDFYDIENYSNLLKNIIKGTTKEHENEKENLFLLYHIKAKGNKTLKLEDCIEILQCFHKIELFSFLKEKYNEKNATPEVDREYEKDKEIKELKKQIEQLKISKELEQKFPPLQKKPMFVESDLFKAVIKGKLDSVQYLIEKQEFNINQQTTKEDPKNNINKGDTALHIALKNNQEKFAQYLLLKGARYDIKNNLGKSAFIYACENKNKEFLQTILSLDKISLSVDEICHGYPLHSACSDGDLSIVQYLIEKGANIEAEDDNRKTPLHFACWKGHLPIVQYLIEKGANIEAITHIQQTPLHESCYYGHLPIVQYLIEKGANIEAKDKHQETPLHIASKNSKTDVVKYLVSRGANKTSIDDAAKLPVDVACTEYSADKSQIDIIRELLK